MIEIFRKVVKFLNCKQSRLLNNKWQWLSFAFGHFFGAQNYRLTDRIWQCFGRTDDDGSWKIDWSAFDFNFHSTTEKVNDKTNLVKTATTCYFIRNWLSPDLHLFVVGCQSSLNWFRHMPFQLFNIIANLKSLLILFHVHRSASYNFTL